MHMLFIPACLIPTSTSIAEKNTRVNIEACGLLVGTTDISMLQVNHLLILKQTATSDHATRKTKRDLERYEAWRPGDARVLPHPPSVVDITTFHGKTCPDSTSPCFS